LIVFALYSYYNRQRSVLHLSQETLFIFLIVLIFGLLYFHSVRIVEYFIPFSILSLAYLAKDIKLDHAKLGSLCLAIILIGGVINYVQIVKAVPYFDTINNYEGCALWLQNNTAKDSHVFIQFWDQMPPLFFYNRHNVYTLGLEEHFLYYYNSSLMDKYRDAIDGEGSPYEILTQDFKVDYVFIYTGKDAYPFYLTLKNETRIKARYSDVACAVLEIQ